ncbi:hypothetical protein [Pusillimonas sp.]|uniref:hypothetical protein n=1 Tax=Pusillimonas sp. TaxID=3040095 RepID=UPI0037C6B2B8
MPAQHAPNWPPEQGRDIDGSEWWLLPALYDADAHAPHVQFGVRRSDALRALAGGVSQTNIAVAWQLVAKSDLGALAEDMGSEALVRIVPLLSVWPHEDSAGFGSWLARQIRTWPQSMPRVCKFYSADPHLERNLDAAWEHGIKPMVWCVNDADLERVVAHAGERPLHLRHATSAPVVDIMRRAPEATIQSSPHFMLELAKGKHENLTVLPSPPSEQARLSLVSAFPDRVDVIASDHVSPHYAGPPISPGLQTQQHFLPALLTLCEQHGWDLESIWQKATTAPAHIFGMPAPQDLLLVDPTHEEQVRAWPWQTPDRAPFEGLTLKGHVLAVLRADQVTLI